MLGKLVLEAKPRRQTHKPRLSSSTSTTGVKWRGELRGDAICKEVIRWADGAEIHRSDAEDILACMSNDAIKC